VRNVPELRRRVKEVELKSLGAYGKKLAPTMLGEPDERRL